MLCHKVKWSDAKRRRRALLHEELADISEGLELKRIACRVEEEHRRLFPDLALEADVGLDDELDPRSAKPLCKCLPVLHREHDAEVRNRNIMAINRIVMPLAGLRGGFQVRD